MDYVKIGGRVWDVLVTEIEESFSILYSDNSGRTLAAGAPMVLDPIGTFFSHNVTFKRKSGHEQQYDELMDFVSIPRYDGIDVSIVHNQTVLNYKAYISQGKRNLKMIDEKTNKVYWDKIKLNIVPISAQVKPQ